MAITHRTTPKKEMILAALSLVLVHTIVCQSKLEPLTEDEIPSKVSLSLCVLEASRRFFTRTFDTVIFTLPRQYSDTIFPMTFTERTLRALQMTNRWSFLVKNLNTITYKFDRSPKSYNYIIQIKRAGEVSLSIKNLRNLPSWNPQAKFLVVSTTIFENPHLIATEIAESLWRVNVIDGAVLLASEEDDTNYTVYSWYPYGKDDCGDRYHSIQPINHCSFGRTQTNRSWFEEKLPKQMHNCTIKANYVDWPPYVINAYEGFHVSNYFNTQGIEINLLNMVADSFHLNVKYSKSNFWGDVYENGTATGDLQLLLNDSIDILIGAYTTTYLRSLYFELTRPYHQEAFIWCVPHVPASVGVNNMINIISVNVWMLLVSVYFLMSFTIWYLSKDDDNEVSSYRNLTGSLLNSFAVMIGLTPKYLPRTFKGRYCIALLILLGINVVILYNTYLTSIMASPKDIDKYVTMNDIYKYKLKTYFMPNAMRYFQEDDGDRAINGVPISLIRKRWRNCNNVRYCVNNVAKLKNSAFCIAKSYIEYLLVSNRGKYAMHCMRSNVVAFPVVMIMRKGFPLFQPFDRRLNAIVEAGFIAKWEEDLMRRDHLKAANSDFNQASIKFDNLKPVFVMVATGNVISLVVFILEVVSHRVKNYRGNKSGNI